MQAHTWPQMEAHDHNRWMREFLRKLELSPQLMGAVLDNHILDAMTYSLEKQMFQPDQVHVSKSTFEGLSKMIEKSAKKNKK